LIAIATAMHDALKFNGISQVQVVTHHGINSGSNQWMTLNEIDNFLDTMFENEISIMGIEW